MSSKLHTFLIDFVRSSSSKTPAFKALYARNIEKLKSFKTLSKEPLPDSEIVLLLTQDPQKARTSKSFYGRFRIFLVWLMSAYESFTGVAMENMNNEEWTLISHFFWGIPLYKLKFKLFCYMRPGFQTRSWTAKQDEALRQIMRNLYPQLFRRFEARISWTRVSMELSKEMEKLNSFKTDKQCKERWFNHLTPWLNKQAWTIEEDVRLLVESIKFPKEWAKISRVLLGRTQHQIKNRFISLLSRELETQRDKIREFIRKDWLLGPTSTVLHSLTQKMRAVANVSPKGSSKDECDDEDNDFITFTDDRFSA